MSVPLILLGILLLLMVVIGRERGAKAFFTLILNFGTLYVLLFMMAYGVDPLWLTFAGCLVISSIILFYTNGFHRKTIASLLSVLIVTLLTILLTYRAGMHANIQGFGKEQAEALSYLSLDVHLDFARLAVCEILIGLLGAIIDVSISISSSLSEIYRYDPSVPGRRLFSSGLRIGRDILGTMTNTLLFAYVGGFLPLMIWFDMYHYSFGDILNDKLFCSEVFQTLAGGIGILLIIPVTAALTPYVLAIKYPHKKHFKQES